MKKLFSGMLLYFMLLGFTCMSYAAEPPEMIILHNALAGELTYNPFQQVLKNKTQIKLYTEADKNSTVIETLPINSVSKVVAFELHTYPYQNKYVIEGKNVYILAYRGEGIYSMWENGKILNSKSSGNKIPVNNCETWVCLRSPNTALEGWTKLEKMTDWYTEKGAGVFLTPAHMQYWK